MKPDPSPTRLRFGLYEADLHTREIWKDGLKLKLAGQPFEILSALLSHPGELVTRDELQKRIWSDGSFVDSGHGLNAAVNKLRDALCDSADDPKYIETLPRRGYRFIGQVEVLAPAAAEELPAPALAVTPLPAAPPAMPEPASIHPTVVTSPPRRWPIFVAASVALVVGALGGLAVNSGIDDAKAFLLSPFKQAAKAKPELAIPLVPRQAEVESEPGKSEIAASKPFLRRPVLQHDGARLHLAATVRTIISGNSGNAGPQFSPDGKRIAFMSNRTGPWQVWLSKADGSDPVQLSSTDSAGTPRWSPDGRSVAFDAPSDDGTSIYVARVDGNQRARPLVEGLVPSFSRDGKWIYYASERSGNWQVWKIPVRGGQQIQVTHEGGFAALESPDGYIYYSKTRYQSPDIWRIPVRGGEENPVSPRLHPRTWASWSVTETGILFVEDLPNHKSELSLYDPKKRETRDLAALPTAPFWMAASADGKKVVMNDSAERQISMLENFR